MRKKGMTQRVWRGLAKEDWLIKKIDESRKENNEKNRNFIMGDHEETNHLGRVWSF